MIEKNKDLSTERGKELPLKSRYRLGDRDGSGGSNNGNRYFSIYICEVLITFEMQAIDPNV